MRPHTDWIDLQLSIYVYHRSSQPSACTSFQVPFIDDGSVLEDGGEDTIGSSEANQAAEETGAEGTSKSDKQSSTGEKLRVVPPPGDGQQIYDMDPMLRDFKYHLEYRYALFLSLCIFLLKLQSSISCEWLLDVSRDS